MAKKSQFIRMSPEVAKGVREAKNAPARVYGKNPAVRGLGTNKGLPALSAKAEPTGAQKAKQAARNARKSANPKSMRSAVDNRLLTKAEAIEQATIKRAGVQTAAKQAGKAKAIERGVAERAARVGTRNKEAKAIGNMSKRAANAGKSVLGKVAGRAAAPLAAFTTGYAIGEAINEYTPVQKWIRNGLDSLEKKPASAPAVSKKAPAKAAPAKTAPAPKATVAPAKVAPAKASTPAPAKSAPAPKKEEYSKPLQVNDLKQDISLPASQLPKAIKPNKQIGGLLGRTDGKWHLRRKAGKG